MLVKALRTSTKLVSNLSINLLYMHVMNTFDIIYPLQQVNIYIYLSCICRL
jgi:hypothetical protein